MTVVSVCCPVPGPQQAVRSLAGSVVGRPSGNHGHVHHQPEERRHHLRPILRCASAVWSRGGGDTRHRVPATGAV